MRLQIISFVGDYMVSWQNSTTFEMRMSWWLNFSLKTTLDLDFQMDPNGSHSCIRSGLMKGAKCYVCCLLELWSTHANLTPTSFWALFLSQDWDGGMQKIGSWNTQLVSAYGIPDSAFIDLFLGVHKPAIESDCVLVSKRISQARIMLIVLLITKIYNRMKQWMNTFLMHQKTTW